MIDSISQLWLLGYSKAFVLTLWQRAISKAHLAQLDSAHQSLTLNRDNNTPYNP